MKRLIFMLMAACVLLASSCKKPEEELNPQLQLQNKPQRPGDTAVVVSPGDSVLPPWIEKWIWVRYTDFSGCWPITETYPPPEDLFGADARAITIDWRDSTYTSQSCKSADNYQIVPEISGRFSMRDTFHVLPNITHDTIIDRYIKFNNGITMGPVEIKEWGIRFISYNSSWQPWMYEYVIDYQVVNSFVVLWTEKYKNDYYFDSYFLRITSQNYPNSTKSQMTNFQQKTNHNQPKLLTFKF